jgi:hypothetical protein
MRAEDAPHATDTTSSPSITVTPNHFTEPSLATTETQ